MKEFEDMTIEQSRAEEEIVSSKKDENRALHKPEMVYKTLLSAKSDQITPNKQKSGTN